MEAVPSAPSTGCRANGDVCTADNECAWGKCVNGWCEGLLAGANCTNPTDMMGCAWNLFCWMNTSSSLSWCAAKKANNQPAVWTAAGYGWSCQSGFFRNVSGIPTCVTYDGWWGTRTAGQQCYYEELQEVSHELCQDGLYCAPNSSCSSDRSMPSTCDLFSGDCSNVMRSSNGGMCYCNTAGQSPVCAKASCGAQGPRSAARGTALMRCGYTPQSGNGKCMGTYNNNWNGSCTYRATACNPSKSYHMCLGNFEVAQLKRVLIPSGRVCNMDAMPNNIWWPSFCSSASVAQPLLVLVVGLMALLRL